MTSDPFTRSHSSGGAAPANAADAPLELAVSADDADAYFAARLPDDVWDAAEPSTRSRALAFAATILESACVFTEDAATTGPDGVRRWRPRIIAAVCEEALWLLRRQTGPLQALGTMRVTSASVAGIAATFDTNGASDLVAPIARRLVGRLGSFDALDDGGGDLAATPLAL